MGYRLFRTIGESRKDIIVQAAKIAETTAALEGSGNSEPKRSHLEARFGELVNIKVADVGPGVFFALFGALLLAYVLYSSVTVDLSAGQEKVRFGAATPATATKKEKAEQLVRAIRTVRTYSTATATTDETKRQQEAAVQLLFASIPDFVDEAFGTGSYAKYQQIKIRLISEPQTLASLSEAERSQYQAIDRIVSGGL